MRSTRHRFLPWCACAMVFHVLIKQNRTTWFWTLANGGSKTDVGDWSRNCTAHLPKGTDSPRSTGPHLCKEAGHPTAVAGGHPGLPSCPTGGGGWPDKCHWPLHHKDSLGGYFGQVNWLPRGQIILGKCLLVVTPFLPSWSSLGIWIQGSNLHISRISAGMVVGDNSSSTIAYGGFFRFQSFTLDLSTKFPWNLKKWPRGADAQSESLGGWTKTEIK